MRTINTSQKRNIKVITKISVLVLLLVPLTLNFFNNNLIAYERLYYDDSVPIVNAKDDPIILINNIVAVNPSYSELLDFLVVDDTDELRYDINGFICGDFATRLHNNAESRGIRCAFVLVGLDFFDYRNEHTRGGTHALNVFDTTDMGLVFIDDTGHGDKTVDVELYKDYVAELLFDNNNNVILGNAGMVTDITVWW